MNKYWGWPLMSVQLATALALALPSVLRAESKRNAPTVMTGIDVLIADNFAPLAGKRVGLITNPTGITADLRSTVDVLHNAPEVKLVALFGPEHGVRGDVFAGEKVSDDRDPATGLPVYSLYGANRKPSPEILKELDVLMYDIQDIGSRSYTYISSMGVAMEAAAEANVAFMVLDRPNPVTGNRIEGRPLNMKFSSMVGKFPIPYIYGLTCGEVARMINGEGWLANNIKCKLTVIPMRGYDRDMWFDETGLPWVLPSPHVPHADVALFYAATGIMGELQVVCEGVGYTLPFELAGAPFIKDAEGFARELNERDLPGVRFRPIYFRPYYIDRVKNQQCGGVQIHITDRDTVDLTGIQFHIMEVVRKLYPDVDLFGVKGRANMFDKVCGTDRVREMLQQGQSAAEIIRFWNSDRDDYLKMRSKYLIYE